MREASELGADLGETAVAAVEGAIEAAKSVGVNTTEAARAATKGVLNAADAIDTGAAHMVLFAAQLDRNRPGVRVLFGVADRFLGDAIEMARGIGRELGQR